MAVVGPALPSGIGFCVEETNSGVMADDGVTMAGLPTAGLVTPVTTLITVPPVILAVLLPSAVLLVDD